MERYVYLSYCEVDYEGSNLCGIHASLEDAKKMAESVFQDAINKHTEFGCEPEPYAIGLSFRVNLFDTQKQSYVYTWHFEQREKVWRSQASFEIFHAKVNFQNDQVRMKASYG